MFLIPLHLIIIISRHIYSAFSHWVNLIIFILKKLYSYTCGVISFLFISVILTYYSHFSRFGTNPSCKPAFKLSCFIRCWKINLPLQVIYSHNFCSCLCRSEHVCLEGTCMSLQSFTWQKCLSFLLPGLLPWLRSHVEPNFYPYFETISLIEPSAHQFA